MMWNIRKSVTNGDDRYLYAVVPEHPRASKKGHYVYYHRVVMEKLDTDTGAVPVASTNLWERNRIDVMVKAGSRQSSGD